MEISYPSIDTNSRGESAIPSVIFRRQKRMATAVAGMLTPHCHCRSANNSGSGGRSRRLLRLSCFSADSSQQPITKAVPQYKPGFLDNLFLHSFRSKMAKETRWDSDKPGYDGLIEVANRLMIGRSKSEAQQASIRILRSLFPPFLLKLYSILISPLAGGHLAAVMVARVTALSCKWLMGPCEVNAVTLPDGTSWTSGVFVERCKYLEESKCVGICVNTCKLPTQTFFKDYMGVPLVMEPNFNDYSCQGYGICRIENSWVYIFFFNLYDSSSLGSFLWHQKQKAPLRNLA